MMEPHVLEHVTAADDCAYCGTDTYSLCSCGMPICGSDECKQKHAEEVKISTLEEAA